MIHKDNNTGTIDYEIDNKDVDSVFISEFFRLNDKLELYDVFDSIINKDSSFFINLLRLRDSTTPEFLESYNRINSFFDDIMVLLDASKEKGDKFYKAALNLFDFPGVKGINLGVSDTGIDAGFGKKLSRKVMDDAFDIVKAGVKNPEIFQLVGLFEEHVASDRLSDMIATIILPDIRKYTRNINKKLGINDIAYSEVKFEDGIAINPYKKCELLYLPKEILHEMPIAKSWNDIDHVVSQNLAIRRELNESVGREWHQMCSSDKKGYLREHIFKNNVRCRRVLDAYKTEEIQVCSLDNNMDYFIANTFKKIKKDNNFNILSHSADPVKDSYQGSLDILFIFKNWVEENKGWDEIISSSTKKREKSVQRLLHLSGIEYCKSNNFDMSFEANEGPGPVDLKISRGQDKTVLEIKLSSNQDYLHGYEVQIEKYAKAEETQNRIFVYVKVGNPKRDEKLISLHESRCRNGEDTPTLFIIDSQIQESASKLSIVE